MPDFEVLAELGDYALIRVTYPKGTAVYTGKRSDKNPEQFFAKAVEEQFFWDLVDMASDSRPEDDK